MEESDGLISKSLLDALISKSFSRTAVTYSFSSDYDPDEAELERIGLEKIEKFVRKKKLENINKKVQK